MCARVKAGLSCRACARGLPYAARDARDRHCEEYERRIEAAGDIDLQLLGLGRTGHIGFNERGFVRLRAAAGAYWGRAWEGVPPLLLCSTACNARNAAARRSCAGARAAARSSHPGARVGCALTGLRAQVLAREPHAPRAAGRADACGRCWRFLRRGACATPRAVYGRCDDPAGAPARAPAHGLSCHAPGRAAACRPHGLGPLLRTQLPCAELADPRQGLPAAIRIAKSCCDTLLGAMHGR